MGPGGSLGAVAASGTAPRKRVRLDYDERRELILSVARRLFLERPYSEVSMADLAAEAGVARGLLHHYFGSKRDLYLDVMRGLIQVPRIPLPTDREELQDLDIWGHSVEGWMRLMEANRDLWLAATAAGATGNDPELQEILDASRELMADRVLEALGLDPATADDALRGLVRGFGGLAEEVTREWLDRGRLTRAQTKALLRTSLPALLEHVLPPVRAAAP